MSTFRKIDFFMSSDIRKNGDHIEEIRIFSQYVFFFGPKILFQSHPKFSPEFVLKVTERFCEN